MEGNVRTTVHKSVVFEEWSDHLTATIGHHSSTPLSPEIPFSATMKVFEWDEVSVVQLSGSSSIRLHRHQPDDRVVIWLPVEGWVQERVNGEMRCAEPGTAMVFLPGDELVGETSRSLCGTSLILPRSRFGNLDSWKDCANRHISEGSEAISLLECAHELAEAFISDSSAKQHLVKALADQLLYWRICQYPHPEDNSYRPSERRAVIASAREWMHAHLQESFRMTDLAANLHLSTRYLQLCFREELGHSPSEEVQRLRFRRLRRNIGSIPLSQESVEGLFRDCGLNLTVTTTRHYRKWCGETLTQTWLRVHRS
jgi:AraC-like DNA-binding protein